MPFQGSRVRNASRSCEVGLIRLQELDKKVSQTKLSPTTQDAKRNGTAVSARRCFGTLSISNYEQPRVAKWQ